MPKYTRTAKYEELRKKLQSDNEGNSSSPELSEYVNRFTHAEDNYKSTKTNNDVTQHDPIHQRREVSFNSDFAASPIYPSNNETTKFDNEYMDEYISEVKQYNLDKGLLMSDNTQQNILRELRKDRSKVNNQPQQDIELPSFNRISDDTYSTKIPSFASNNDIEDLSYEDLATRDRITSKMQTVLSSEPNYDFGEDTSGLDTLSSLESSLAQEKSAREHLLTQTNKMRAQMDEYEDNLTDVSDKMQHTNRILNFVLVVLIFALIVVLCVIFYMVLLDRGAI